MDNTEVRFPAPLVIVIGALHGNEPAGVHALQEIFTLLEQVKTRQPDFAFNGKLIGLIGHLQAFQSAQRFTHQDLNRLWLAATVHEVMDKNPHDLSGEDVEIRDLYMQICRAIQLEKPESLVMLDLHTTSAAGGIFCIPTDEAGSLHLARDLHTPVILDLLEGISGTLLDFATEGHFKQGLYPQQTLGVAFEAGQHSDPLSVQRSVSAVLHALQTIGCLEAGTVNDPYENILPQYSAGLPQVTRLLHVHRVHPNDQFRMRPGYVNFQPIVAGELLADDIHGPVPAPCNGLMLMPLYQPLGTDGFFLVAPSKNLSPRS